MKPKEIEKIKQDFLFQLLGSKKITKKQIESLDMRYAGRDYCFICGHPLNKNEHIDKLLNWLEELLKDL